MVPYHPMFMHAAILSKFIAMEGFLSSTKAATNKAINANKGNNDDTILTKTAFTIIATTETAIDNPSPIKPKQ